MLHRFYTPKENEIEISFSEFVKELKNKNVEEVTAVSNKTDVFGKFKAEYKKGAHFKTTRDTNTDLVELCKEYGLTPNFITKEAPFWQGLLLQLGPAILLIALMIFFLRQLQVGGGKAMSFGKSKARLLTESHKRVTFKDVAGVEEAKEELYEIIDFLKDPKKFTRLGGRIPKGVLLMGAPGTGKTLLAKAIAGEAGVPFFSISGSDFVEMFVGVGASRVRDLFEQGKKRAPCIIFIDEIDAVGRSRGAGLGGGHDEREQTLNQLLVEMDGFESNEGVILIAATNRPDVLDPALLRPGRFDRRVVVPPPDVKGREAILKVHARKSPLAKDVDLMLIARGTPGFTGADLENLVNEAALIASKKNQDEIIQQDFEEAKDKVLMGAERRSLIMTEEEKRNTAYHEAGHALVARSIEGTDPIHKVTIIPRGRALGLTQMLPQDDRFTMTKKAAEDKIAVMMGGRIAEELVLMHMTSGAANDFEGATELARKMVCEWGMSEKLGPVTFAKKDEPVFLGRDWASHSEISERTSQIIDEEIKAIIQANYERARALLQERLHILHNLAQALLEHETLDRHQVELIVSGKVIPKKFKTDKKEKKEKEETVSPAEKINDV